MRYLAGCLLIGSMVGITRQGLGADDPAAGKQVACELQVKTGSGEEVQEATLRYWLYLPADYDGKDAFPLVVFLHGAGERGDDLELVKKWGPPKLVSDGKEFPFVLVSPQCPRGGRWDVDQIARLTDHIAGTFKIEKRRMYITGLSMGGYGTWGLLAKHPKLFAAAAPICGGGDPESAAHMVHVPIWAFHGDKDTTVPLQRSQDMVDAVNKAGGKAKLTVYPGVGHNSWSETYDNPEVYKWLLSHQREE